MEKLDKVAQNALKCIYAQFENANEITVSSPNFEKTIIDYFVSQGLLEKTDATTLRGWTYIVRPTYAGELVFTKIMNLPLSKVETFIKQGEVIMKEEYHRVTEPGLLIPDYIDGPKSDLWFSEISIFNNRVLNGHPLYAQIEKVCNNHSRSLSAHKKMMGYLRALAADDEFWADTTPKEKATIMRGRKTIDQLLAEDIERCEQFLENPADIENGIKLYVEITGRYDGIIPGFGNGLYQYFAEQHFYDPDISGDTLRHNLTVLLNKMVTYQATNYPAMEANSVKEVQKQMSNNVFVVHGHDNEAVQEMARALEKGGFKPIILHEQPDAGLTIIEKIERYADVCYAVVLYTECDKGRDKNVPVEQEQNRARQNVVFEHGYLIGRLGRDRVSALVKGTIETPGDISGVVYIAMDKSGAWKVQLAKNMQDVGLPVDMNVFCR